jgi:indole-3-glycerol phosphate synthase
MDILTQILQDVRLTVSDRQSEIPLKVIIEKAYKVAAGKKPHSFYNALNTGKIEIIAEIKKASPSRGIICKNFDYRKISYEYTQGGAAAISVLTEEKYFSGRLEFLSEIAQTASPPLLRKDFIVHEYQIYEAAAHSASAVLLIAAALDPKQLRYFLQLAHSLNMDALVEVHDFKELEKALNADAKIIGVNNRDLKTFKTTLQKSLEMSEFIPAQKLKISESGIRSRADIQKLEKAGYNAVLIGETLMRQADRAAFLKQLRGV